MSTGSSGLASGPFFSLCLRGVVVGGETRELVLCCVGREVGMLGKTNFFGESRAFFWLPLALAPCLRRGLPPFTAFSPIRVSKGELLPCRPNALQHETKGLPFMPFACCKRALAHSNKHTQTPFIITVQSTQQNHNLNHEPHRLPLLPPAPGPAPGAPRPPPRDPLHGRPV